jgi:hypothetical protein
MEGAELIQGSQEWLDFRRGKCTASNFKIIMSSAYGLTGPQQIKFDKYVGMDPAKLTATQDKEYIKLAHKLGNPFGEGAHTYAKKIAGDAIQEHFEEGYTSYAMEQGNLLEPVAIEEYEKITFSEVDSFGFISLPGNDFIGGSPDGLIANYGGIEAKCPQPAQHIEMLLSEEVSADYVDQIQGLLLITQRKWWDFISYNPNFKEGFRIKTIRVLPDKVWQTTFLSRVHSFQDLVDSYKMRLGEIG